VVALQVVEFSGKLVDEDATPEKARFALPLFDTVTVCGLLLLVEATEVEAKLNVGGFWNSSSPSVLFVWER
jgi:hypothetical protein